MKTLGRNVEIAMAVYIALGIAITHRTLYDLVFSACCGLLCLAIMMYNRGSPQKFGKYDSWGWSKASTKGFSVWMVIFFVGGLPFWQRLIYSYFSGHKPLVIPYWQIVGVMFFGATMGVAVYFRGYLRPLEDEIADPKSLELEHREWFGLFQAGALFAAVLFVATGYSYVAGLIKETPLPLQAETTGLISVILLCYLGAGYIVWILRPLHGRGKEIRDHISKLKQAEESSKQPGAKNET
ncbi:hypothetical protein ES702_07782 [subsurface metagenome]